MITGKDFNALIPDDVTSIEFLAMPQTYGLNDATVPAGAFDVSEAQDGSVMAWVEDTTMYVVSVEGNEIYANPDSSYMFNGKQNLTSINAENLNASGAYNCQLMFYNCKGLTDVNLDDFNLGNVMVGASMFTNCSWLTEYTFAEEATIIDKYMFRGCSNLITVNLPSNLDHIGFGAFWNCKALTEFTIPASVTEIETSAFANCTSLTITFAGTQEQWDQVILGEDWNRNVVSSPSQVGSHKCESVCKDCGGCVDATCVADVCASKCKCEPVTPEVHNCESVCKVCGYCLDATCVEAACTYKCKCEIETGNVRLGILNDYNEWKDAPLYYQFEINGQTFDVEPDKNLVVSLPVGTHDVVVYAVFADGSRANTVQSKYSVTVKVGSTSSFRINFGEQAVVPEEPTPGTPVLGEGQISISIVDKVEWKEIPVLFSVMIGDKEYDCSLSYGQEYVIVEVPNGTYEITVYAHFADGSATSVYQFVNEITIDENNRMFEIVIG